MSSPNEPGPPRTGDSPGGANGSSSRPVDGGGPPRPGPTGPAAPAEPGDVTPPWQRGASRTRPPQRTQDGPPKGDGGRGGSPAVDARINQFISGGPAAPAAGPTPVPTSREPAPAPAAAPAPVPAREPDAAPLPAKRSEPVRPEVYASELPDLSGPNPRPPQRKPGGERSVTEPATRPTASSRATAGKGQQGPVRASMQVRRFDPWSVLKVSLVLSVVLFFVWMIAVAFLYLVLGGMGVWSKLNSNVGDLLTSASGSGGELVSSGAIFGGAALIGLVNIVLFTAMATCGAFIYNLTTDLVGGIEVTLADRD